MQSLTMLVQHSSGTSDAKGARGFSGGFRIGGKTINNLKYADDIILLATSPEELQELVSRVERVAKEYNMLINATKTKVMTNNDYTLEITVDKIDKTRPTSSVFSTRY